ncbi:MAG: hypothetical protein R3C30_09365 [Hyphomonadaceae bacterium]
MKGVIEAFWRARGAHVDVFLVSAGFQDAMRGVRFDIRSSMKNGLPRKSIPAAGD